jgi:hypothetical protein
LGSTLPDVTEPSSGLSLACSCCKAEADETELAGGAAWAETAIGISVITKMEQQDMSFKNRNAVYSSFQHGQIRAVVQK